MKPLFYFRMTAVALSALGLLFVSSVSGFAESKLDLEDAPPVESLPLYRFQEHLAEAEAFILESGKEKVSGIWREDALVFPNFSQDFLAIRLSSSSYNGVNETGIFFHTFPGTIRRLRFSGVPAGSSMVLYYGIDDQGISAKADEDTSVYLRIWVGKHELRRLHISNTKGWSKEVIPLGVLSFLKHDVTMTFETTSENREGRRLSFRAEILP